MALTCIKNKFCEKSFKRPQDLKKHERIHSEENIVPVKMRSSHTTNDMNHPLTPPGQSDMSLSPNPTSISHISSSLKVPISPPHSTATYSDGK